MTPVLRVLRQDEAETQSTLGLGAALRSARRARGLSLAQVAAATDISRSLLSLIETGRNDVTIGRLIRLSELYGVHVSDLLSAEPPPDHVVVRADERRHLPMPEEGLDLHLLTPDSNRAFLPFIATFVPGSGAAEGVKHPGEEFVHVLEGKLRLEVDGAEPVVLEEGDSAYYNSDRAHRWSNAGSGLLRLLSVAGPPPI
jgi:transcriptional regulator with XRE-family HTH domain